MYIYITHTRTQWPCPPATWGGQCWGVFWTQCNHTHTHTHTLSLSFSLSLSLSRTHPRTHLVFLPHGAASVGVFWTECNHTHTHILSLSLCLSVSLPLSHSHARTHLVLLPHGAANVGVCFELNGRIVAVRHLHPCVRWLRAVIYIPYVSIRQHTSAHVSLLNGRIVACTRARVHPDSALLYM
jgi:hypothetical protein